jgi:hypothetical protein
MNERCASGEDVVTARLNAPRMSHSGAPCAAAGAGIGAALADGGGVAAGGVDVLAGGADDWHATSPHAPRTMHISRVIGFPRAAGNRAP